MLDILIADDHPVVRSGIRAVLAARPDWRVCGEAATGEETVLLANQLQPEIVIVDYALPVLNGIEAMRQIRKAAPKTKLLVYTMHDDDTLVREAVIAGAQGYILKSEDDATLLAGVDALARGQSHFSQKVSAWLRPELLGGRSVPGPLTTRERAVVQLVAEGDTNQEIADRWGVSIKTVETQRASAMRKLGLRSAVDVARYAIRNRLIQP
ncbi:MAG: response regulator transcription factor [Burkholderiales bacterium]|nr:response regulator transcription factor [Burkholderiales bacterium]